MISIQCISYHPILSVLICFLISGHLIVRLNLRWILHIFRLICTNVYIQFIFVKAKRTKKITSLKSRIHFLLCTYAENIIVYGSFGHRFSSGIFSIGCFLLLIVSQYSTLYNIYSIGTRCLHPRDFCVVVIIVRRTTDSIMCCIQNYKRW